MDIRFSLIIPLYRNELNLPSLLLAVADIQHALGPGFEAVFVVDGSPDACYNLLRQLLPQQSFPAQLILHSRNFGSFAAIRTGLKAARGQFMAVMAADLQEPPELAIKILQILQRDEADVVVGARDSRHDPFLSSLSSRCFWWLYKRLVMPELPEGGVDIFGCNDPVRKELVALEEAHSALIGQLYWLGFRRTSVSYQRRKRQIGRSAWTFRRKLNYLLDSVLAFSDLPFRLLLVAGAFGVTAAILLVPVLLLLKLCLHVSLPETSGTVLAILFAGSLNLLGLGIVGIAVWRAYVGSMRRPQAINMLQHEFGGHGTPIDKFEREQS